MMPASTGQAVVHHRPQSPHRRAKATLSLFQQQWSLLGHAAFIAAASIARLWLSLVERAASFTTLSLLVCPSWTHWRPLLLLTGSSEAGGGFGLLPLVQHTRAHHAVICHELAGLPLAAPRPLWLPRRARLLPWTSRCRSSLPQLSGKGLRPPRARYCCSHGLTPCGRPNELPRQPLGPRCPSASRPRCRC